MSSRVLLYWPNIVGYVRIGLLFAAWAFFSSPIAFLPLYSCSILLDGADGWLARRLKQESSFGAWLDVVVDNLSRTMLWTLLYQWGWLVSSVEWCVFVCNHCSRGEEWKNSFNHSPKIIRKIMANGFRSPLGVLVVGGLHLLPLWFYCSHHDLLPLSLWSQLISALLLLGRGLALVAEGWCIWTHINFLIKESKDT